MDLQRNLKNTASKAFQGLREARDSSGLRLIECEANLIPGYFREPSQIPVGR